jgi:hypothetical protein
MTEESDKQWGLLGKLQTDDPTVRPHEPTIRDAISESVRIARKLAVLLAVVTVAVGVGYLIAGRPGAAYSMAGVVALLAIRYVGEALLRGLFEHH